MESTDNIQQRIKSKLDSNNNNYHIRNTHFKIGANLHSEDFYYAKPLFQNSKYTTDFAKMIVEKIKKEFKISTNQKIILIGYEMYSEMLLSIVRKTLKENGYDANNIKHFVGIDNEGLFSFKPSEKKDIFWLNEKTELLEECHAVIIVPIASTGSTAAKIKNAVEKEVGKIVTPILKTKLEGKSDSEKFKELDKEIEEQISKIKFSDKSINVIAAQDYDSESQDIKDIIEDSEKKQIHLIKVQANWHFPAECTYCFDFANSRPLFGTDKSYLTPSLIFNNPKGKTIPNDSSDKTAISDIDEITFDNSLKYKRVKRNNEFFLFSVNSPQFIKDNEQAIISWLKKLKQDFKTTKNEDKIVILAPCHETNSEFLNFVNELVFDSNATIIYYQANVDYIENYKPLNEDILNDATKVFYVDDNLISGSQFFDVYHLFRDTVMSLETTEEEVKTIIENTLFGEMNREVKEKKTKKSSKNKKKLTGAILLRDSSTQETHDRFLRAVNQCRSFVAYNLPPALSFDSKKPLEHERKRFADLRQFALHDVLIKRFDNKEQELNVESNKGEKQNAEESNKEEMFKTTHKVFDCFAKNESKDFTIENLLKYCYSEAYNKENKITLLKVLTQYPFILYKPLKEKAFDWHKCWLNTFVSREKNVSSYDDFKELKFLIRRAVFLDNLQIIAPEFLSMLSGVFSFVETQLPSAKSGSSEEKNYKDFPIFLVRIYLELVHKNGWTAVKLFDNIKTIKDKFTTKNAKRFVRMLELELAAVVNDFYETIIKQYDREWRDILRDGGLNKESEKISQFIESINFTKTNQYIISEKVLKVPNNGSEYAKFLNFLWIKQLIHADTHSESNLPKEIGYQDKIDAIVEKMKSFFSDKETIQAFFVVTDGQEKAYIMYDKENILRGFENEYDHKDGKMKVLCNFLEGKPDSNDIAKITIEEYQKNDNQWIDCYNNTNVDLAFLDAKWLFLIRLSELKDNDFRTFGMLGFYSPEIPNFNTLLPKQLLMLLRRDLSKFILKHHKNDEFAALRLAQQAQRLAFLAGHGRQMMQDLASDNRYKDIFDFKDVVTTMSKLQYLFALDIAKEKDLKSYFYKNYLKGSKIKAMLENMSKVIYETDIVENSLQHKCTVEIKNFADGINININKDILEMICFELVVNAKKNRWHDFFDAKSDEENYVHNLIIKLEKENDFIKITTISEGTRIHHKIQERINKNKPIKDGYDLSGLDLIRQITEFYNGNLCCDSQPVDGDTNKKHNNSITVKLKLENNE